MKKIFILLLLLPGALWANTIVLVHGYDNHSNIWQATGIYQRLITSFGRQHAVFAVELPNKQPVDIQARSLNDQLSNISRSTNQPIILVGHSNGGLVARYLLTKNTGLNIQGLITIASPHLGSGAALVSHLFNNSSPFGVITDILGPSHLKTSKILYSNTRRGSNFLRRLNSMPHPNLCYVSIIRKKGLLSNLVSAQDSQNMNNIPALKGQSRILLSHDEHALNHRDFGPIAQALEICIKP